MQYLLILGATSDIAVAIAQGYARQGYNLYLAGRNREALEPIASDIQIRNDVETRVVDFDASDYGSHAAFFAALDPKPAGVVCAIGYLGDQELAQTDFAETQRIITANFTGCVSILNIIAHNFEQRGSGFIVGISSVAGDRGRQSNYFYGSAKAGFSAYLSGLRNRLARTGVQTLTVKPGFVATKMTEGMDLPGALTAQPSEIAADIIKAQRKGKSILYTKWFWRYIMMIIKAIPEFLFKKLKL